MIAVSAPARVCLLGEHQDYLGLSVISGAMDLRLRIQGEATGDGWVRIELPDLGDQISFPARREVPYAGSRDYLKSGWNVACREGWAPMGGCHARVESRIPIAKGASSSSALVVGWIRLLAALGGGTPPHPERLAWLAYLAEVGEFGEPGGMQDHYAIALGGLVHIDCRHRMLGAGRKQVQITELGWQPQGLLVVDSGEWKETIGTLKRVRDGVEAALGRAGSSDLRSLPADAVGPEEPALWATLVGREVTAQGLELLRDGPPDPEGLARLIRQHHQALRDGLGLSTPAIERFGRLATEAGALAFKVLGSGGGGLLLVYAPQRTGRVLATIRRAGGTAHPVRFSPGAGPVRS